MFPGVQAAIDEFNALDIVQAWRSQPAERQGRGGGGRGATGASIGCARDRSEPERDQVASIPPLKVCCDCVDMLQHLPCTVAASKSAVCRRQTQVIDKVRPHTPPRV